MLIVQTLTKETLIGQIAIGPNFIKRLNSELPQSRLERHLRKFFNPVTPRVILGIYFNPESRSYLV